MSTRVALGPLPLRAAHFVAPLLFTIIGGGLMLGALVGMTSRDVSGSCMGVVVAALLGGTLLATAVYWTWLALARTSAPTIEVTAGAIQRFGGPSIPRVPGESVWLVRIRGGRGQYPVWAIDYGNDAQSTRLVTWLSFRGPAELEPIADLLRRALAAT